MLIHRDFDIVILHHFYKESENIMKIGQGLYPDEWVESVFAIDFENYYEQGFRGIVFDIDNTLVPHGKMGDDELKAFVDGLKEIGFKIMLVSNNSRERNDRFAVPLGLEYIHKAGKPGSKGYIKAYSKMKLIPEHVLCIGDQLFTDILGGNRAGMHTILVNPIDPSEEIQIILKRKLEKPVLFNYKKKLKKAGKTFPDYRMPEGKAKVVNNFGEKSRIKPVKKEHPQASSR